MLTGVAVFRTSPAPPLERITLEYMEDRGTHDMGDSATHHSAARNAHLVRRHMRELQACLLQVPTLRTLEFRLPRGEEGVGFGSQIRAHVRESFAELDARGMLAV